MPLIKLNDQMNVVLDDGAFLPERAHPTDAGLDLRSPIDINVRAHGSATIATGVVDEGYTGGIKVKLYNHGMEDYMVHRGDKIAQLVVSPVLYVQPVQVEGPLPETPRGDNGFGSTGR